MTDFEKRIAAIEHRLNMTPHSPHPPFRIVIVEGGLPGPINWAYAGSGLHRWKREAEETLEAFVERAAVAARDDLSEVLLIVGGLPRGIDELGAPDFETWWATIAPFYSDVPEVTTRAAPDRPRLGD